MVICNLDDTGNTMNTHVAIHHKSDHLYNVISYELAVAIKLYHNLGVTNGVNVHCYIAS